MPTAGNSRKYLLTNWEGYKKYKSAMVYSDKVHFSKLMTLPAWMLGEIMNEVNDRYQSVKEVNSYLGVSCDTVFRWVETHLMPVHRMELIFKFTIFKIDAWVKGWWSSRKQQKDDL